MRTLGEILEASKTGGEWPTHEECFWAMQSLEQLWQSVQRRYVGQVHSPSGMAIAKRFCDNEFKMGESALKADPKRWLGPSRDFSNPENRRRRDGSLRLMQAAIDGKLPNQKAPA